MALHSTIHLALRQRMVDVWGAYRLEVPAPTQDTAAAPITGGLYDVVCVDLALSVLRCVSAHVSICSVFHEQPPRRCHVILPLNPPALP